MPEYTITIAIHGGVGSMNDPHHHSLTPGDALTIRLIDYDVTTMDYDVEHDGNGDPFIEVDTTTYTVVK